MNSQELDNDRSGKRLNLPEPDPDNITVLTRNLPNKPILPWHHYDSPWSEANEENPEGSEIPDTDEAAQESEVISTETPPQSEADNPDELDKDELDDVIESVAANGIEATQNLLDEASQEELRSLDESLPREDIEESKAVELDLESGQEELFPLTEPLPTEELEESESVELKSEFIDPELLEEAQALPANQLDSLSTGEDEFLEDELLAAHDEELKTVEEELKQLG